MTAMQALAPMRALTCKIHTLCAAIYPVAQHAEAIVCRDDDAHASPAHGSKQNAVTAFAPKKRQASPLRLSSGIPPFDDVIALIHAQHRVMRSIQSQQTRELRIHVQPLRGQDTQNMGMRNQ